MYGRQKMRAGPAGYIVSTLSTLVGHLARKLIYNNEDHYYMNIELYLLTMT